MPNSFTQEEQRILDAYERRKAKGSLHGSFFVYESIAHLMMLHERYRETLCLLRVHGFQPLTSIHILDIGCGDGSMLRQFIQWGAQPENLAGIELRREPIEYARRLNSNVDYRFGNAISLPWPDTSFDLVCQHTVFTSILDDEMRQVVAREMERVLRPKGAVLWYDFMYNNPVNPDVRGVKREEIMTLFHNYEYHLRQITLAPPITRSLPSRLLPVLYPLLTTIPFLNTHYLGLLIKPEAG